MNRKIVMVLLAAGLVLVGLFYLLLQRSSRPSFRPAVVPSFLFGEITAARIEHHDWAEGRPLPSALTTDQLRRLVDHMKTGTPYRGANSHAAVEDTAGWAVIIFSTPQGKRSVHFWDDYYFLARPGLDPCIIGNRVKCLGIGPLIFSMANSEDDKLE